MEYLPKYHEDHPNQHKNSHKLCDETRNSVSNVTESQWKLRRQMIKSSQWKGSHCRIKTEIRRKINPKDQDCDSHKQGSKQES